MAQQQMEARAERPEPEQAHEPIAALEAKVKAAEAAIERLQLRMAELECGNGRGPMSRRRLVAVLGIQNSCSNDGAAAQRSGDRAGGVGASGKVCR